MEHSQCRGNRGALKSSNSRMSTFGRYRGSYTMIPGDALRNLGMQPHTRSNFIMADSSCIEWEVGRTWVRIGNQSEITLVMFANEDTEPLLGAYTLQGMLLAVDTPNERLVPVPDLLKTGTVFDSQYPALPG